MKLLLAVLLVLTTACSSTPLVTPPSCSYGVQSEGKKIFVGMSAKCLTNLYGNQFYTTNVRITDGVRSEVRIYADGNDQTVQIIPKHIYIVDGVVTKLSVKNYK